MIVWLATLALAAEPRTELGAGLGGTANLGRRVTNGHAGAHALARHERGRLGVDVAAGMGRGVLPRINVATTLGADVSAQSRGYRPAVGLEVGAVFGQPLRAIDTEQGGGLYTAPAVAAVRLRVAPLTFRHEAWTVAGLVTSVGVGVGAAAFAPQVQVVQVRRAL